MLTWTFSQLRTNFSLPVTENFKLRPGIDLDIGDGIVHGTEKIGAWTLVMVDVFGAHFWQTDAGAWQVFRSGLDLVGHGMSLLALGMANSPAATVFLLGTWYVFVIIADTKKVSQGRWRNKIALGTVHFFTHLFSMWLFYCVLIYVNHTFLKVYFDEWAGPNNCLWLLPKDL